MLPNIQAIIARTTQVGSKRSFFLRAAQIDDLRPCCRKARSTGLGVWLRRRGLYQISVIDDGKIVARQAVSAFWQNEANYFIVRTEGAGACVSYQPPNFRYDRTVKMDKYEQAFAEPASI